jgi:hypothetical protein
MLLAVLELDPPKLGPSLDGCRRLRRWLPPRLASSRSRDLSVGGEDDEAPFCQHPPTYHQEQTGRRKLPGSGRRSCRSENGKGCEEAHPLSPGRVGARDPHEPRTPFAVVGSRRVAPSPVWKTGAGNPKPRRRAQYLRNGEGPGASSPGPSRFRDQAVYETVQNGAARSITVIDAFARKPAWLLMPGKGLEPLRLQRRHLILSQARMTSFATPAAPE